MEEGQRRRPKRRRVDTGAPLIAPTLNGIRYGHCGQVEPGRLIFDLVSCDGGELVDPRNPEMSLGPDNLLRHDKSVYCSERPFCNIALRHTDGTPFCLEKLHIIGPEDGFLAP